MNNTTSTSFLYSGLRESGVKRNEYVTVNFTVSRVLAGMGSKNPCEKTKEGKKMKSQKKLYFIIGVLLVKKQRQTGKLVNRI